MVVSIMDTVTTMTTITITVTVTMLACLNVINIIIGGIVVAITIII